MLEVGDLRLTPSVAILQYLSPLARAALFLRGRPGGPGLGVVERVNSFLQPLQLPGTVRRHLLAHLPGEPKGLEAVVDFVKAQLMDSLGRLEAHLGPVVGRYAVGDTVTAADVLLVPQLDSAERMGLDLSGLPTLCGVRARCQALDAFQAAACAAQSERPGEGGGASASNPRPRDAAQMGTDAGGAFGGVRNPEVHLKTATRLLALSTLSTLFAGGTAHAASFHSLLSTYSGYDYDNDGIDEIDALSPMTFTWGNPSSSARVVVVFVEDRLLDSISGASYSTAQLTERLERLAQDLRAEGYTPRFVQSRVYDGAAHQDGKTVLAMHEFLRDVRQLPEPGGRAAHRGLPRACWSAAGCGSGAATG